MWLLEIKHPQATTLLWACALTCHFLSTWGTGESSRAQFLIRNKLAKIGKQCMASSIFREISLIYNFSIIIAKKKVMRAGEAEGDEEEEGKDV